MPLLGEFPPNLGVLASITEIPDPIRSTKRLSSMMNHRSPRRFSHRSSVQLERLEGRQLLSTDVGPDAQQFVPDQVLVQFQPGATEAQKGAAFGRIAALQRKS